MTNAAISIAAPAKINLYLRVLGRRNDGYHAIESVFLPLDTPADRLRLKLGPEGAVRLHCSTPVLPTDERNLCVRAARAYLSAAGEARGVTVDLSKRIPVAAGLGGGSSDAAAVFLGLNRLCGNPLDHAALVELSRSVGADVPFFLDPVPALGTGIGDVLRSVPLGCDLALVLANARFPVPVSWAYAHWQAEHGPPAPPLADLLEAMRAGDVAGIAGGTHNDLEEAVFRKFPILGLLADALRAAGAYAVRMTGSGPTLFALCEPGAQAQLAEQVRDEFGPEIWVREATVAAHPA